MNNIDWAKLRAEAEAETIADKMAEILTDSDAYECHACAIEGQPCDVGLAVKVERERIINLLLDLNVIRRAELDLLVAFDTDGEKVVYLTGLEKDK